MLKDEDAALRFRAHSSEDILGLLAYGLLVLLWPLWPWTCGDVGDGMVGSTSPKLGFRGLGPGLAAINLDVIEIPHTLFCREPGGSA